MLKEILIKYFYNIHIVYVDIYCKAELLKYHTRPVQPDDR